MTDGQDEDIQDAAALSSSKVLAGLFQVHGHVPQVYQEGRLPCLSWFMVRLQSATLSHGAVQDWMSEWQQFQNQSMQQQNATSSEILPRKVVRSVALRSNCVGKRDDQSWRWQVGFLLPLIARSILMRESSSKGDALESLNLRLHELTC